MADRTSAELFGNIFKDLAKLKPSPWRAKTAQKYFKMIGAYDFSEYQMYADRALIELGLAHKGVNPDYPEDGVVMIYTPPPKRTSARRR